MAEDEIKFDDPGRVDRLAKALSNRRRIAVLLAHANGGPESATGHALAGLDRLGNVSYHQAKLLEVGALRRVSTRKVRGAHEHVYDLTEFGREVLDTAVEFGKRRR